MRSLHLVARREEYRVVPVDIGLRMVQRVVQAAAFFAAYGRFNYQVGDLGQVAQLNKIVRHAIIAIIFSDFTAQQFHSVPGALQALVGAHNAHVVPHKTSELIPVVRNNDVFIRIGNLRFVPEIWRR